MIIVSPVVKLILKIASFVIYVLTGLCAFGGYISPDFVPLASVMVLVFPYMVVLTVLLIILWLCLHSWVTAGVGIITMIICWTPVRMNYPLNHSRSPAPDSETFTLLTWNVAHGDDFSKPDVKENRTFQAILEQDADIVCLQEMIDFHIDSIHNITPQLYDSICRKYPYRERYGSYDVQFFSKYPFTRIVQSEDRYFPNARFARFDINGHRFLVCNVHLPSYHLTPDEQTIIKGIRSPEGIENSLRDFRNNVYGKLTKSFPIRAKVTKNLLWNIDAYKGPAIVCGDFNDVPASWTYRLFIKDGFKDAYAETNFFATDTFYNNFLLFHIDQIMYRGMIRPLSVDRIDVRSSDHYGLVATFEFI